MIERSAKRARPIRRIPRQGRRRLHPPACARCAQGMVGARWPQPGVTLTDRIVDRVGHNTMNVFKVPQSLADKYHGAGYALAATVAGQLVDIVYLADVLPDFRRQARPTRAHGAAPAGPGQRAHGHVVRLGVRRAMTVADLRAWQAAMGFTYESAAEALGMSPFGLCQVCPRCLPPTTGARRWPVQPLRRGCKHGRRPPESLAQIQHPAQWLGQSPPNFPPITVKKSMNMRKYNPGSGHQSSVSACAPIAQNHTNQWVGAQWIEALRSGMECAGCRCSCPSLPAITRHGPAGPMPSAVAG